MHKVDKIMVRVVKTDKLDQRKLKVIANRYGISPISVRELQRGYAENIPRVAADLLVKAGLVKQTKDDIRPMQERVDSLTTEHAESVVTTDDVDTIVVSASSDVTSESRSDEEERS